MGCGINWISMIRNTEADYTDWIYNRDERNGTMVYILWEREDMTPAMLANLSINTDNIFLVTCERVLS